MDGLGVLLGEEFDSCGRLEVVLRVVVEVKGRKRRDGVTRP